MDVTFDECVKERNNIKLRIDVIQHRNVQIRGNYTTRNLLYLHGKMEMIWCFQNVFLRIQLVSCDKIIHLKCGLILCFVLQRTNLERTNISFVNFFFKIVNYNAKKWFN